MNTVRALLAMLVVVFCATSRAAPISSPPSDKAVVLDLHWLAPPAMAPDPSMASVIKLNDCVRLTTRPGSNSPSFTWALRYPIPAPQYPILVLRYRTSTIGLAERPILQVEASQGAASFTSNVITVADLKQDGTVQEFRRSLAPLPEGSSYTMIRFALPPAVARMDILELRFETAADSPTPAVPAAQTLEVNVVDEFNHPVADAEVRAGPLERSNWSSIARTSDTGQAMLTVTPAPMASPFPGAPLVAQPIEVSVAHAGYTSQYAASMQLPLNGPLLVRLAKVQRPTARQQLRQEQPEAGYGEPVPAAPVQYPGYGYTNDNYWNGGFYGGGWGYGSWPGGVWVVVVNPTSDHGQNDGDRHKDHRTAPVVPVTPPPLKFVPWKPEPVVPAPTQTVVPMPTEGVVPMPTQGVVPMPTQGVFPMPTQGVTPLPTAPGSSDGTVSPPINRVRRFAPPVMSPRQSDTFIGRPIIRPTNDVAPVFTVPAPRFTAPPSQGAPVGAPGLGGTFVAH